VSPVELSGPLLALSRALADAVQAAGRADAAAFDEATSRLGRFDGEHVRRLLGAVVRPLLESSNPDGVDGDDLLELLEDCARAALPWWPGVEPVALAVVLTGAFGIDVAPREELPVQLEDADVTQHAVLVVDHVLRASGRPLRPALDAAFAEIAREDGQDT
jgi:hypothetical protein